MAQPAVIGCILSGPGDADGRLNRFHEFHLLDKRPIAPAELQTRRTLAARAEGLAAAAMADAPPPADSPAGRLAQMRQIARDFTAHMEATDVGAAALAAAAVSLWRRGWWTT